MFSYFGQISNLQVKTDDENIPSHPHNQPGCVLQREAGRENSVSGRKDLRALCWRIYKVRSYLPFGVWWREKREGGGSLLMFLRCRATKPTMESATNQQNQNRLGENNDNNKPEGIFNKLLMKTELYLLLYMCSFEWKDLRRSLVKYVIFNIVLYTQCNSTRKSKSLC